jgi:exonuclease VII large subunit
MTQELIRSSQVLNPSTESAASVETEATPEVAQVESTDNDDDALIDLLADEPEETTTADTPPDFDSPEMSKLSQDFKKAMGVDLKEAYQQFTQAATQLAEMQSALQEQAAQTALSTLSTNWGVTGEELDKRVKRVLAITEKMSEKDRAKYDSVEGIQKLWDKIASKRAGQTPGNSGQNGSTSANAGKRTYKTSELRDLMTRNPTLYNSQQAQIEAAFREGRVIDDL